MNNLCKFRAFKKIALRVGTLNSAYAAISREMLENIVNEVKHA